LRGANRGGDVPVIEGAAALKVIMRIVAWPAFVYLFTCPRRGGEGHIQGDTRTEAVATQTEAHLPSAGTVLPAPPSDLERPAVNLGCRHATRPCPGPWAQWLRLFVRDWKVKGRTEGVRRGRGLIYRYRGCVRCALGPTVQVPSWIDPTTPSTCTLRAHDPPNVGATLILFTRSRSFSQSVF
jgi:hypothetical protein